MGIKLFMLNATDATGFQNSNNTACLHIPNCSDGIFLPEWIVADSLKISFLRRQISRRDRFLAKIDFSQR